MPDFFIPGAPKCGTTALYRYLATHPAIAMSSRKEPGYWSPDLGRRDRVSGREAYLRLWEGAPEGALRGEATANYLRSAVAIPSILAERPDARFVVMLRNPSDMAVSLHSELVKTYHEDVGDFERAWRLQETRRQGLRIPPECVDPRLLDYAWGCALGDQVERLAWCRTRTGTSSSTPTSSRTLAASTCRSCRSSASRTTAAVSSSLRTSERTSAAPGSPASTAHFRKGSGRSTRRRAPLRYAPASARHGSSTG